MPRCDKISEDEKHLIADERYVNDQTRFQIFNVYLFSGKNRLGCVPYKKLTAKCAKLFYSFRS